MKIFFEALSKTVVVFIAGCFLFATIKSFDSGYQFIPNKFAIQFDRLWRSITGFNPPIFDRRSLKPSTVEVEEDINMLLDPNDLVPYAILVTGSWQPEVFSSISSVLEEGAVFIDVGAHIGYFSLKAGKIVGQDGKVIAFEPNPNTLETLKWNIKHSNGYNIIVQPVACGNKEDYTTLYDASIRNNSGMSSLSAVVAGCTADNSLSYQVKVRPIDDVVGELGLTRVDVVKMDIEGAETMAIMGAKQTLRRFHPKLILEVNPYFLNTMNSSVEELSTVIRDLGYTKSRQIDDSDWEWTATKINQ